MTIPQLVQIARNDPHFHKTLTTLRRYRAAGTYDSGAAHRLLRNNARHAARVAGVRVDLDAVAVVLAELV